MLEGLRLKLMVELDEVRQELREVDADLSLLREAGRIADAEFAARKAVRLLCHEADVKERLDAPVAHRITAARNGIARILEVSLRQAGREAMRLAQESAQPGADPALARESFARAEAYNRLVAEAHRVTGGVDVPVFLPDHVARLRDASAATVAGAGARAGRPAGRRGDADREGAGHHAGAPGRAGGGQGGPATMPGRPPGRSRAQGPGPGVRVSPTRPPRPGAAPPPRPGRRRGIGPPRQARRGAQDRAFAAAPARRHRRVGVLTRGSDPRSPTHRLAWGVLQLPCLAAPKP